MSKGGGGVKDILQLFPKVAGEVCWDLCIFFKLKTENSISEENVDI